MCSMTLRISNDVSEIRKIVKDEKTFPNFNYPY